MGAEGGAQVGFDEPVDEQGDADDGDQRLDAVVVVQEDRPHVQGLFEVAVAWFDDPLVFVDLEHIRGGQRPVGWVGQVGGQGIKPVEAGCGGESTRGGAPGDGGGAVVGGAGGDGDQLGDVGAEDLGDPVVDLLFGLVVAPAAAVADAGERGFCAGQGAVAGLGDGGGLLGGPDVGPAPAGATGGVGVVDLPVAQQAFPHGAGGGGQSLLAVGAVIQLRQGFDAAVDVGAEPARPAGGGAQRHHESQPGGVGGAQGGPGAWPGACG